MNAEEKQKLKDVAVSMPNESEFIAVREPKTGKFAVWLKRHLNFAKKVGLKILAIADTVGDIVEALEDKNEAPKKTNRRAKRKAKNNDDIS